MKEHDPIIASVMAMRGLTEAVVKKYIAENVMFTSRSMALQLAGQFAHSEEESILLKQMQDEITAMRQSLDDTMKILNDMVDSSNDLIKELPMGLRLFYRINLPLMITEMSGQRRGLP